MQGDAIEVLVKGICALCDITRCGDHRWNYSLWIWFSLTAERHCPCENASDFSHGTLKGSECSFSCFNKNKVGKKEEKISPSTAAPGRSSAAAPSVDTAERRPGESCDTLALRRLHAPRESRTRRVRLSTVGFRTRTVGSDPAVCPPPLHPPLPTPSTAACPCI